MHTQRIAVVAAATGRVAGPTTNNLQHQKGNKYSAAAAASEAVVPSSVAV